MSDRLASFVERAKPYSNWPDTYFRIRRNEYELINALLDDVFERGGDNFLDIGCGTGFACVYASQFFKQSDGVDVDAIDSAFNVREPAARVGARLTADIPNVSISCGDPIFFLKNRKSQYDMIFTHFVLEHVEHIDELCRAASDAMKPGSIAVHVVPNTHDTIVQLLEYNLRPEAELKEQARAIGKAASDLSVRTSGRQQGMLYTPITHSEFISDYRKQFEINSSERYLFPLIESGLKIRRLLPAREHAYVILAEKP